MNHLPVLHTVTDLCSPRESRQSLGDGGPAVSSAVEGVGRQDQFRGVCQRHPIRENMTIPSL